MWCKVHCLELKKEKEITKKLYHVLHIDMKHVGKQEKSLGYRMSGWISIIVFCVCLKFANPSPLVWVLSLKVKKQPPGQASYIL